MLVNYLTQEEPGVCVTPRVCYMESMRANTCLATWRRCRAAMPLADGLGENEAHKIL